MGVIGFLCVVLGGMAVVASVNGRLPLVLAAFFGQAPPIAPTYNSVQQQPGNTGWSSDPGQVGGGDPGGSW